MGLLWAHRRCIDSTLEGGELQSTMQAHRGTAMYVLRILCMYVCPSVHGTMFFPPGGRVLAWPCSCRPNSLRAHRMQEFLFPFLLLFLFLFPVYLPSPPLVCFLPSASQSCLDVEQTGGFVRSGCNSPPSAKSLEFNKKKIHTHTPSITPPFIAIRYCTAERERMRAVSSNQLLFNMHGNSVDWFRRTSRTGSKFGSFEKSTLTDRRESCQTQWCVARPPPSLRPMEIQKKSERERVHELEQEQPIVGMASDAVGTIRWAFLLPFRAGELSPPLMG